jgi:lysophospholipase L1-like esterase
MEYTKIQRREARICFLGESFVNGTGDLECLGWTGRICVDANKNGYDVTYYNLGIRRETSSELKNRWLNELLLRLPKEYNGKVVFSFGVNDTAMENGKTRVTLVNSILNTHEILTSARQLYPVLMISPPPVLDKDQNARIAELSRQFAFICKRLDIDYLDVFSILEKSHVWMDEVRNNDGAHPKAGGYQELAEIVRQWDGWLNFLK